MRVGRLAVFLMVASALRADAALAQVTPAPKPTHRIADAEIIGTLGTTDANISEAAKLAGSKAQAQDVRSFASLLLRDHQRSQQQGLALAKQLHVAPILPRDSAITRTHKQEMDQLNLISPAEFDRAFVQLVVADHKAALARIDSVLLPAARRAQLRAFIRRIRPIEAAHAAQGQAWIDKQKPKQP